jgi:3-deoxy-D-manno-octulosonic-acid transferase
MSRMLYSLAWWLALPLVLARLWWRGRKEPGYRRHIGERFGFYGHIKPPAGPVIWVHAVSVGETRAAEPLVDALLTTYPDHTLLITHMTATGRETGQALFAKHGPRFRQAYLPYDLGPFVAQLIDYFSPRICILMETEVWPNLIAQCGKQNVPVVLLNARLSEKSLKKAQRFANLMQEAAHGITLAAAQTEADAQRLRQVGVPRVEVTGSIKFDVVPPAAMLERGRHWRAKIGGRPVLLCASTREGEEALILDALKSVDLKATLLLIVPRHPQRFDEVAQMIRERGYSSVRRSAFDESEPLPQDIQIVLGDSMGEMFAYYAACDLAYIGGSLLPLGGQNLIEACALGKPVLVGLHTFNFALATEEAIAAGAALRVADSDAMLREVRRLLSAEAERQAMSVKAAQFAQQHRGATSRTIALIKAMLDS